MVLDISKSGFRVISGLDLARGAAIQVTLNSVAIFGVVCHSRKTSGDSFLAGVRIKNVVPAFEEQPLEAVSAAMPPPQASSYPRPRLPLR
jgi:hypothetical protein